MTAHVTTDAPEVRTARRAMSWINRGKRVAGFLVAIGVAGEFVMDFWAEPLTRRIDDAREATISQLKKDTAEAELAQERLRADNLRLQATIQPRRLRPEQEVTLRSAMSEYPGEMFVISVPSNDLEAVLLGVQLATILNDAGWNEEGRQFVVRTGLTGPVIGMYIIPGASVSSREAAERLAANLQDMDIFAVCRPAPEAAAGRMEIRIGTKPLPYQEGKLPLP